MDKETFAHQYGFKSYETMLKDSTIVLYDYGVSYYITMTAKGWFAWVDKYFDKPLGWFQTFKIAQELILEVFNEVSANKSNTENAITRLQ